MPAERYCRVRANSELDEEPFTLDRDGFLDVDPDRLRSEPSPGALITPAALCSRPAAVLLGEPGIGKSTTLMRAAEELRQTGKRVSIVDGALITDATVRNEVEAYFEHLLPKDHAQGEQVAEQVLILDQMDESSILPSFSKWLRRFARGRDISPLNLVVACRLTDYPADLTSALEELFGSCVVADLAPLTRAGAIQIAQTEGFDGDLLVAAAIGSGASALARIPLTLLLLGELLTEEGTLRGTPTELFSAAVRRAAEKAGHVTDPPLLRPTSLEQRLSIAGRIAARLLLSGRRSIWWGRGIGMSDADLALSSVVGGTEPLAEGDFEVTRDLVEGCVSSALFSARGNERLAFAHGSTAAYLAAKHLIEREVPDQQLRGLFLVSGTRDWASIPPSLREAAAWLVTLAPGKATWLAQADAISLAGHSDLVHSPQVRRVLVAALLEQADEAEVAGLGWRLRGFRLSHPDLSDQLRPVLRPDTEGRWPNGARLRLALRLAAEAEDDSLLHQLLDVATSRDLDSSARRLAVSAAFAHQGVDPGPFRELLMELADPEVARREDPDDELKGVLLEQLWPDHLPAHELVRLVTPRQDHSLFGIYWSFLNAGLRGNDEEAIQELLNATVEAIRAAPPSEIAPELADTEDSPLVKEPSSEAPAAGATLDTDFLSSLAREALRRGNAVQAAEQVAELLWPRLEQLDNVALPSSIDVPGDSAAAVTANEVRLALADNLVRKLASASIEPVSAYALVSHWDPDPAGRAWLSSGDRAPRRSKLLDADDFEWAAENAVALYATDADLARAFANVAIYLFNPYSKEAFELAYTLREHPLFVDTQIAFPFVSFAIDGELAQRFRAQTESGKEPVWEGAPQFAEAVKEWWRKAIAGDVSAFWQLAWNLQFDPKTGRSSPGAAFHSELQALPAVSLLDADFQSLLPGVASAYLRQENDHGDEWLGTDSFDKRAWAGYQALALLARAQRLEEVGAPAWSRWASAVLWFWSGNGGSEDEVKRVLLQSLVQHADVALADAIQRLVKRSVERGAHTFELDLIPIGASAVVDNSLRAVLFGIGNSLLCSCADETTVFVESQGVPALAIETESLTENAQTAATRTWEGIADRLVAGGDSEAVRYLLATAVPRPCGHNREISAKAASLLLKADPGRFWSDLRDPLSVDGDTGKLVADECGGRYNRAQSMSGLSDEQLVELTTWLMGLYPPDSDPQPTGSFVEVRGDGRDWRQAAIVELAGRASHIAVEAIERYAGEFPSQGSLRSALLQARLTYAASSWHPPQPQDVARLLRDPKRRIVQDDPELAEVIVSTLADIAVDLPAHGELLWDRRPVAKADTEDAGGEDAVEVWWPKPEAAVSAYLAHELKLRLASHQVVVNREVLILPTNAYGSGERTDILIQAISSPLQSQQVTTATTVVEVKGSWNDGLLSSLETQLADRYLPETGSVAGVYVVTWYPLPLWITTGNYRDRRKSQAARHESPEELTSILEKQADDLSRSRGFSLHACVMSVPRPAR